MNYVCKTADPKNGRPLPNMLTDAENIYCDGCKQVHYVDKEGYRVEPVWKDDEIVGLRRVYHAGNVMKGAK